MRAAVSRADLVRVYRELGAEGLERSASVLGFYRRGKKRAAPKPAVLIPSTAPTAPAPRPEVEHRFESGEPEVYFWRAVSFEAIRPAEGGRGEPEWLEGEREISEADEVGDVSGPPPPKAPLVAWSRLWPFLFAALGRQCDSRRVNLDRALHLISHARPIKRLPYVQRLTWAGRGQLIVDAHEALMPFWDDGGELLRRITRLRGVSGLEVLVFENHPDEGCREWIRNRGAAMGPGELRPYTLPVPGAPVLVLSDLGCLDREEGRKLAWLRLGNRLKRAGFNPVALMPCPPRLWDPELAACWTMVCWDRGFAVPRSPATARTRILSHPPAGVSREKGVERLMAVSGAAVRVEPALLRALRLALPHEEADVGSEAMAWQHADVYASPVALGFKPGPSARYRSLFFALPPERRRGAVQLIRRFHAHLPGSIRAEEEVIAGAPDNRYLRRVLKTGLNREFSKGLGAWLDRLFERGHQKEFTSCPVLNPLWFIRNQEAWEQGRIAAPPGADIQQAAWVLAKGKPMRLELGQQGMTFSAETQGASPLLSLDSANNWLAARVRAEAEEQRHVFNLEQESTLAFPVPLEGRVTLDAEGVRVELETFRKPKWADEIGRNRNGLYAGISTGSVKQWLFWLPPGRYPVAGANSSFTVSKGFWMDEGEFIAFQREGFVKPDWADIVAIDQYGIYADFSVKGVVQRMRLILPGEFKMGSPEHEKERLDRETLHDVLLTERFWLAESACTQALWQAVMGENPSRFKGPQRPVEQVSWEDCKTFIDKINRLKPGLDLCLPTEAQWEYACRSGTETPFWFGDNITPEQVNYDGNVPYAGGKKGKYREETADVKSLPCNGWGLYQMHGNVWEWCADWYGEYAPDLIVNPTGPDSGEFRVLRGGGWFYVGRGVRSAFRDWYEPSDRDYDAGFRFAQVNKGPGGSGLETGTYVPGRPDGAERNRQDRARERKK
jgi:formylglycine-generating enzyme required for sulfatase activity